MEQTMLFACLWCPGLGKGLETGSEDAGSIQKRRFVVYFFCKNMERKKQA